MFAGPRDVEDDFSNLGDEQPLREPGVTESVMPHDVLDLAPNPQTKRIVKQAA